MIERTYSFGILCAVSIAVAAGCGVQITGENVGHPNPYDTDASDQQASQTVRRRDGGVKVDAEAMVEIGEEEEEIQQPPPDAGVVARGDGSVAAMADSGGLDDTDPPTDAGVDLDPDDALDGGAAGALFGATCVDDGDCASNVCRAFGQLGNVCTQPCTVDADCPAGSQGPKWVRGTTLTDYEKRLDRETYAAFLSRYRERLFARLRDERPYFFAFKRIFLWARRATASESGDRPSPATSG